MDTDRQANPFSGFSLIELLVVVAVLGVCLSLTLPPLYECVTRTGSRTAAQVWQCATAWTQLRQLAGGGSVTVEVHPPALDLCGPSGDARGVDLPTVDCSTNLSRWRVGEGVRVSFGGELASPDAAGSVYFGPPGLQTRVVVRAESGFTYRAVP
ncbi:MAG: prepilin-type N-terminal cleavage/methylation domain-containing protein [Dehalococcoidales bacterium]|nr:prepilin-type N-terminal cleavage/methylation domain-containing protein [Dehalococcoidales bacterium]